MAKKVEKKENLNFSVVSNEKRYAYDFDEPSYGAGYINWGSDNAAPELYLHCYENSATLKAIIDGYVSFILGNDVKSNNGKFEEFIGKNGYTVRQFLAPVVLDYMLFGGFSIQVIYNKFGIVSALAPISYNKLRYDAKNRKLYFNNNWGKYTSKAKVYDAYDPDNVDLNNPIQIYYFRGLITKSVYPKPTWFAAINDILTEIEIGKYSLNTISNGFMAKYVLNFPNSGNLTDEQKSNIEENIKNKFCGVDTDSNFMLLFSTGDNKMDIQKIDTTDDVSERYIAIKNACRENIFISLRATPALFGLPNATNGFSTDEYKDSYKIFQSTCIKPIQQTITEAINVFCGAGSVVIEPFAVDFENKSIQETEDIQ